MTGSAGLQTSAPATDKSNDQEQYDGPDERDEDRSPQTREWHVNAHRPENPAADKRAKDTDDDITEEPKACTTHDKRREKTGNKSDDKPGEKFVHVSIREGG